MFNSSDCYFGYIHLFDWAVIAGFEHMNSWLKGLTVAKFEN